MVNHEIVEFIAIIHNILQNDSGRAGRRFEQTMKLKENLDFVFVSYFF